MSSRARPATTIIDVARGAGVAISSVSSALNGRPGVSDATRERVRAVAAELGYVPSVRGRGLSAKRAYSVGFVVQRDFDILESDPFFGAFIGGVEQSLAVRGYALALQIAKDSTTALARFVELADNGRVDGVFIDDIVVADRRLAAIQERGLVAVGINPGRRFPFPAVRQDGVAALTELLTLLITSGHTRIAHVRGPSKYVHSRQRLATWRAVLRGAGLSTSMLVEGDFTVAGGRRAADALLTLDPGPTAIFCANDLTAIGVMNRLMECGLAVPRDVSVAGFDGIAASEWVRPRLTTVATSPQQLGRDAARMLLELIDGEAPPDTQVAPAILRIRESTGPAPSRS